MPKRVVAGLRSGDTVSDSGLSDCELVHVFLSPHALGCLHESGHGAVGAGRYELARVRYLAAIDADPHYEAPLLNLALFLVNCPEEQQRDPEEAVRLAERACAASSPINPLSLAVLAEVYSRVGRADRAAESFQKAIQQADKDGDAETRDALRSRWQQLSRSRRTAGDPKTDADSGS